MIQELTIEQALSHNTGIKIKNNVYLSIKEYIQPFIEKFNNCKFKIYAKLPDKIPLTNSGNINFKDVGFIRVLVEAYDSSADVLFAPMTCMAYGLDTKKPVVKFYQGYTGPSGNFYTFTTNKIYLQEIEPEKTISLLPLSILDKKSDKTLIKIEKLQSKYLNLKLIDALLGRWIQNSWQKSQSSSFGIVKFAVNDTLNAFKTIFLDSSGNLKSDEINKFQVYDVFTKIISENKDKDILNVFEKTLLLKDILEL